MQRSDYNDKMNAILADASKFQLLGPTETHDRTYLDERALQAYLLRYKKAGKILNIDYDRIRPVGSCRPVLYGVPKIHKKDVPLRPILSMINAPQHEMAKWLAELLKPVLNKYSAHATKDTFEFVDEVREFGQQQAENSGSLFLCSFDVVSLFTNVPLKETIDICIQSLYHDDEI